MNNLSFLFVFFLNPFVATIRALRTLNEKAIVFGVTLFMGFFGTTTFFYGDNQRYRDAFFVMHEQVLSWDNFINTFYDGETTFDVAIPLISYAVSLFTGNEKILFAIFGLIFGYFFSKNIVLSLQISKYKDSKSKMVLFFVIIFSFIYPFWAGTNAVRFVIANTMFFYFLFQYITSEKKVYLLYLFIPTLFHFSFIIPIFITYFYLLSNVKKQIKFLFVFFIISLVLVDFAFEPMKNIVSTYTPSFLNTKVNAYTSDFYIEHVDGIKATKSWHSLYYFKVFRFTIGVLIIHLYFYRKKISNNPQFNAFFPLLLFYFSFANIISVIQGLDRFLQLAYMFSIVCILIFLSQIRNDKIFKITLLPLTFWFVVIIRTGFDFVTVGTIISNPVLAFYGFLDDFNLRQFIK